jgi:NAD(P)-dependent dehydrogenase (short-subunit alcohol dehydrogenase family)
MSLGGWCHTTKFAVEGLSDSLRPELAPFGIKVFIIEPGVIDTEWGGIATDSLVERSGKGAYADQVAKIFQTFEAQAGALSRSKPDVVAKTIGNAVSSAHPRPRYAIGLGAKPLTYARRMLPDPVLDRALELSLSAMSRDSRRYAQCMA